MKAGGVEVREGSVSAGRELLGGKFDSLASETTRGNEVRGWRSVSPNEEETVDDHT